MPSFMLSSKCAQFFGLEPVLLLLRHQPSCWDTCIYNLHVQGGPKKTAHGVCGNNFVNLSTLNNFS